MSLIPRYASLPVFQTPGGICKVDIASLYAGCGSVELATGPKLVDVKDHAQVIVVTPTQPGHPAAPAGHPHGGRAKRSPSIWNPTAWAHSAPGATGLTGVGGNNNGNGNGNGNNGNGNNGNNGGNNGGNNNNNNGGNNGGNGVGVCANPILTVLLNLSSIQATNQDIINLSALIGDLGETLDDALNPLLAGLGDALDLDDLLGGLLGGGDDDTTTTAVTLPNVPLALTTRCGINFSPINGGQIATTGTASECVQRCGVAAVQAVIQLGEVVNCLGVTFDSGLAVNNCLYFLGDEEDVLSVNLALVDGDAQSFCLGC